MSLSRSFRLVLVESKVDMSGAQNLGASFDLCRMRLMQRLLDESVGDFLFELGGVGDAGF